MSSTTPHADRQPQTVQVLPGQSFRVTDGANIGDGLSHADELILDDIYSVAPGARTLPLTLEPLGPSSFSVASGSPIGTPGALVHLDSCVTVMDRAGETTEFCILVQVDGDSAITAIWALPLSDLAPGTSYTLVRIDRDGAAMKLAHLACVSFARGTRLTMATGELLPIETLAVGDRVLTRDSGPQQIRWIGQSTVRATGDLAPVVIRAGAMNNDQDLVVSPNHRLFIYQRTDALKIGRPQVMVRACHLVNGTTVLRRPGGFVEYFQVLFDTHQIIYAEGIAAETLLVEPSTRAILPRGLARRLTKTPAGHSPRLRREFDLPDAVGAGEDIAEMLRRASEA